MLPKYGLVSCVTQTVAYSTWTDRKQTDREVKTEEPKFMSNNKLWYLQSVINVGATKINPENKRWKIKVWDSCCEYERNKKALFPLKDQDLFF